MSRNSTQEVTPAMVGGKAAQKKIETFRDLVAWQRGMDLCENCYRLAERFPRHEQNALADQIRRASSSVPLNIAEGYGLGTRPNFLKHLRQARASLCEISTAVEIAGRLKMTARPEILLEQTEEAMRIVQGLINSLERTDKPQPRTTPRNAKRS